MRAEPSWTNNLLKIPSPNTVALGDKVSHIQTKASFYETPKETVLGTVPGIEWSLSVNINLWKLKLTSVHKVTKIG
jgi:hypothetical protein